VKCLDTDFLVAILRGKNDAKSKMESLDAEGRNATTMGTPNKWFTRTCQ
jgi:hypothetical protein